MIGFAVRLLATVLLAGAVVSAVLDITRSIAASAPVLTSLGESGEAVLPALLDGVRTGLSQRAAVLVPVLDALLALPTWAVLGVASLSLFWAGRPRRTIGSRFARE